MPSYTLHYFNGRGRAEILRMLFNAAGVQYNDTRYEFSDWDRCRNDFPCNYLPCLEMDGGNRMPETMSIARHLAREYELQEYPFSLYIFVRKCDLGTGNLDLAGWEVVVAVDSRCRSAIKTGFYPKNHMDMMRCDYISDCFYEILHDYMRYFHSKNGRFRFGNDGMMGSDLGSSDSNSDNYMHGRYMNTFNRIMPFMERTLAMRNGGSNYFMGDDLMWCDMMMYCCLESMYLQNQSMFSQYPKLMGHYNRVAQHPKISGYLKIRCNTPW